METQNDTTTPNRVMIGDRPTEHRARLDVVKEIQQHAATLAPLFAALDLGEMDAETLADVYATGGKETRRRWMEHAQREAENLTPILRSSLIAGLEANTPQYFTTAKQIHTKADSRARYLLGCLTMTNEGATLTDEGAARLADDCKIYLTDPDEIAKYNEHAELIKRLNAFFEDGKALPPYWVNLFPIEGGKFTIPNGGADYSYFVNRRRELEEARQTPEQMETTDTEITPTERPEPKQNNRQRRGTIKGITRQPEQHDRGAEMRNREHKVSPDIPDFT